MYNLYVRVGEFMNHDKLKKNYLLFVKQVGKEGQIILRRSTTRS